MKHASHFERQAYIVNAVLVRRKIDDKLARAANDAVNATYRAGITDDAWVNAARAKLSEVRND